MKSRRSFLALVATAFICSMSTLSPAHAGNTRDSNTMKFMAKQGAKFASTTMREAKKAKKEKEAKKKKEKSGE